MSGLSRGAAWQRSAARRAGWAGVWARLALVSLRRVAMRRRHGLRGAEPGHRDARSGLAGAACGVALSRCGACAGRASVPEQRGVAAGVGLRLGVECGLAWVRFCVERRDSGGEWAHWNTDHGAGSAASGQARRGAQRR